MWILAQILGHFLKFEVILIRFDFNHISFL
jgi:hypothetical protein